jgi:hypothetical protein
MATYQDFDWTWLKEASQHMKNSGVSALHNLFEPGYLEKLLGPSTIDIIRSLVGNEYFSTGAFLLICGEHLEITTWYSNLQSNGILFQALYLVPLMLRWLISNRVSGTPYRSPSLLKKEMKSIELWKNF